MRWELTLQGGPDFDEMELLLSLDGGRTFPLRVTREIAPETTRVAWRVPAFAAEHARLALRTGSEGGAGSETVRLVSEEFTILPASASPLEELFRVGTEWRTRDALAQPTGTVLPSPESLEPHPERISRAPAGAAVTDRRTETTERSRSLAQAEPSYTRAPNLPAPPALWRLPAGTPKRE